jgi:acyl carrier protein
MKEFEAVKKAIMEVLNTVGESNVNEEQINMTTLFADELDIDIFGMVHFIMCLEDEYDIEIDDEDVEKIVTVRDAVDCLIKYQNKREI